MEKEPLKQSGRFKVFVYAIIFDILMLGGSWLAETYQLTIPTELMQRLAELVTGLVIAFIIGRSYRNTSSGG
jgi:hypothetical protein